MLALAAGVTRASGWRRYTLAFVTGAAGAFALAPFDFFPALVIPMTAAIWLIDGCEEARPKTRYAWVRLWLPPSAWRAFFVGWFWGFGYFAAGLWWLGAAFLVEAEQFAWALPLGVAGLPAALAISSGLGFMLARLIWPPGSGRLFAFAAGLSLAEWLRGHLLTGFPWNLFGMALGGNLVTAQLASVIGLYGLTIVAILIFSAPAAFAGKRGAGWELYRVPLPVAAALLGFAGICGFGALRLSAPPPRVMDVNLRIMQPNLTQDEKFRQENGAGILARYLALSARGPENNRFGLGGIDLLIWPESAFPFILDHSAWALAEIGAALPKGTLLVTGAARARDKVQSSARPDYFNAIQVVAAGGRILASYDKMHLVPFGEYLPFQAFFDHLGLRQFVHVPGGFAAGTGPRSLTVPGMPRAAPLICYEAIFPGEAIEAGKPEQRPQMLLNVTNDGWFGITPGPYQHFAQARLRAIEEGLPLIRAANTGISAIVDPYGRVIAKLQLGTAGVLDGGLPQSIAAPPFARFPFTIVSLLWLIVFGVAVGVRFGA